MAIPEIVMPPDELADRYARLPDFPEAPGDRRWYERLRTLADFIAGAPAFVAWQLGTSDEERARARRAFPALYRLAFDACGLAPPKASR